jgi:probable rRNA maturation factor
VSGSLFVRDRQHTRKLDVRALRLRTRRLLTQELGRPDFDIGVYVVGAKEMTRLNETHLRHAGSTDVITFDYADPTRPGSLSGEIFICIDEAILQARRYRTDWQAELLRYVVHGVLHLSGYDDRKVADRRRMKREEDRLLAHLIDAFALSKRAKRPRMAR